MFHIILAIIDMAGMCISFLYKDIYFLCLFGFLLIMEIIIIENDK